MNSLVPVPSVSVVRRTSIIVTLAYLTAFGALAGQQSLAAASEQLAADLQSEDVEVRRRAALATRSAGEQTQQQLLPLFSELLVSEKDGQVRLAVFDTVTDMGPAAAGAVPALIHTLKTEYGGKRNEELHQDYRSAMALAAIGASAVEPLRELLSAEADNVRAEVAMALGRIGPSAAAAVPELVQALSDTEQRVRLEASTALGRIGEAAVEELLKACEGENPDVRAGAVRALGITSSADERVLQSVLAAVREDSPAAVRAAGVTALSAFDIADDERRQILLLNLQSSDEAVRLAAVNALVSDRPLLKKLQPDLSDLLTADHAGVTWHAAFLLRQLGPESAPMLIDALRRPGSRIDQIGEALALIGRPIVELLNEALVDSDARVRQGAALALGQILPLAPGTVQKLSAGLADPDRNVQAAFLTAIGNLGPRAREAVPAIREKLHDDSPAIRQQAIGILFEAAERDAALIDDFAAMLSDDDPNVQRRAIDAIRSAGPLGRRALPAVVDKLRSPDGDVRIAAAAMIGSHGRAAAEAVPALTELLDSDDPKLKVVVTQTLSELGSAALPAFDRLTTMLDDENVDVRAATVRTIGNLDLEPPVIRPFLARALHDQESDVRRQAFRGLQRFGRRGNIFLPDIILLAADEDSSRFLNRALERYETYDIEPQTVSELVAHLDHESDAVRLLAIRFLGIAGPAAESAVARLESFGSDENEEIRAAAETALGRLRGAPAATAEPAVEP